MAWAIRSEKCIEGRCKASVYSENSTYSHQCRRNEWKDGWCKQHHPDTEAERDKKQKERWSYEARHRNSFPYRSAAYLCRKEGFEDAAKRMEEIASEILSGKRSF